MLGLRRFPRAPGIAAGQSNRTTTATYFDYQGIIRTAQPGELRPSYVYQDGLRVQKGYLRETQATNYIPQSNKASVGASVVVTETIAPDGKMTPCVYDMGTASDSAHRVSFISSAPNEARYLSFFIKPISGIVTLFANNEWTNNSSGAPGSGFNGPLSYPAARFALQNGWYYYCSTTELTKQPGNSVGFIYAGGGITTVYGIWGLQLTDTPPSSLIITTGSPATRTAD